MTAVRLGAHPHLRLVKNGLPRLAPAAGAARPAPQVHCAGTSLPLFHRPAQVVMLSEDEALMRSLAQTLPRRWRMRAFQSATSCLNYLQQEPPRWEADLWAQQDLIAQWHCGSPLIPLILRYWTSSSQRHLFTGVTIADGLMAGTDGLEVLSELVDWPGHRVLLHGAFDVEIASRALERRLIDGVVAKSQQSLHADLLRVAGSLLATPSARHQQLWYSTLNPAQLNVLRRAGVAADLHAYLHASFTEWIFIGDPFGALCLDAAGAVHWLQLESVEQLDELADIALEAGMPAEEADEVRCGRKLSNQELRGALLLAGADAVTARQIGDEPGVFAASTRIELTSFASPTSHPDVVRPLRDKRAEAFMRTSRVSPVSAAG